MKTPHNSLLSLALLLACAACTKETPMAPSIEPDCSFPFETNDVAADPERGEGWVPTEPFLED